jgi:RNA polymerase sigma-70 factor (ECF subfamily)
MQEKELVKLSQEGNTEAFSALVAMHKTKIFNLAFGLTRDREVSDDLTQDVFIKAWTSLGSFRGRSEFGTWLYRIAVNRVRDEQRKRKRAWKEVSLEETGERAAEPSADPSPEEAERIEEEKRALVREAIATLPKKHQVVLALRDIEGLSYEEISSVLKLPPGTVESRLHRARKKLREKLEPFLIEEGGRHEVQRG